MKIQKLFQKTLFGIFMLFGVIGISTSALCIYTVDTQLSKEYETNAKGLSKTIADASVDIILNRGLSALQSLIDQFVEIQGISYIYVVSDTGEILAHTFVPGIPAEILKSDRNSSASVKRSLPGMGNFVEVSSPILAGVAGKVYIGMDTGLIALKIQRAIGQQIYLISGIFLIGVLAAIWLVNLAANPLASLLVYAIGLARASAAPAPDDGILVRDDEVGQIARLLKHISGVEDGPEPEPEPDASGARV